MLRETIEETGLSLDSLTLEDEYMRKKQRAPHSGILTSTKLVVLARTTFKEDEWFFTDNPEVEQVRFFSQDEIQNFLKMKKPTLLNSLSYEVLHKLNDEHFLEAEWHKSRKTTRFE